MSLDPQIKNKLDNFLKNTHDIALRRRAEVIITGLKLKGDETVLDAGCGDGYYLKLLKNLYPNIKLFGIDIDHAALNVAYKNLETEIKNGVSVGEGSITDIKFVNETFDRVFATEVLEHVPDDVLALREVRRVLKKGGFFIFTVPNYNFPFFWDPINYVLQNLFGTHIKKGFWAGIWNQHIRLYTLDSLSKIVATAGDYKIEDMKAVTHYSLPFHHYILNLGARILHDTNLINKETSNLNKFQINESKTNAEVADSETSENILLRLYKKVSNAVDSLNDNINANQSSVSIYFKISKSE